MKKQIVFATNNKNKLLEVSNMLGNTFSLLGLKDIGCNDDIAETSNTIEGNAILKAEYVYSHYKRDCFADDTGLLVDALHGEPGVKSARYAGEKRNSEENIDKLLFNLKNIKNRNAHFRTVIALIINGKLHLFNGICKGEIIHERRGTDGFGYDSIFRPLKFDKTFAQMSMEEKNKIGHRGIAVRELVNFMLTNQT